MSAFVRINKNQFKVRIFEQASRRMVCVICNRRAVGIRFRYTKPRKIKDRSICHECIVRMSLGEKIEIERGSYFGPYSPAKIVREARIRKAKKSGPQFPLDPATKVKCKYCPGEYFPVGMHLHVKAKHPDVIEGQVADVVIIDEEPDVVTESDIDEAITRIEDDIETVNSDDITTHDINDLIPEKQQQIQDAL